MSIEKQKITSFLREIIIVVLGVLIAVYISKLRDDAQDERFIKKTLFAIEEEIKENKLRLEKVLDRHRIVIDSMHQIKNDEAASLAELLERFGGIQYAGNTNIGLRFFISSKAELVDYKTISQLSKIEFTSDLLSKKMENLIEFSYNQMEKKDSVSKLKFVIYLSNVIDSESNLIELYDHFLNGKEGEQNNTSE